MKKKIITVVIVPIAALALLGVGVYLVDDRFNLGIIDSIRERFEKLSRQEETGLMVNDNVPLEVEIKNTSLTVLQPSTSITVTSNKEILIDENQRFKLTYISEREGKKYYVLEIFNIGVGSANLTLSIKDNSNNSKDFNFTIIREGYSLPYGLSEIADWEDSVYTVDGDNLTAKVDKGHKLVEDYSPTDLVDLNKDKLLYTNSAGILLRSEAADYLALMLKDLQDEKSENVVIASGYRSITNQFTQYVSWVRQLGQSEADKVSARPGYSEHSLGTSVDFMSQDSGFTFTNTFDQTAAGIWLRENAHKYGFVQSYPEGKQDQTGYNYEAWHYRYIGIDNASELRGSGLTLKEWLSTRD